MSRPQTLIHISISQALFTLVFLIFFFTLLNGYVLNLVSGYRAHAWLVLAGLVVEMVVVILFARGWVLVERDPLELAGFLIVIGGVWLYFVAPSLPTLLPPTQSNDAVRVYLQVLFSYPEGTLVSWYPAGGAFVAAMFSRWLGWAPLRVLYPTAASFLALSASAVYGIACALLPQKRIHSRALTALLAPALVFVPWSYFAGTLMWEQYFYAQAFAQYFVIAALWYIASHSENPHWIFLTLLGAALLGIVAAYPYLVALPLALFTFVALAQATRRVSRITHHASLVTLGIFLALLLLAAIALQHGGILELKAAQVATISDVGAGGVANPSIETLGGPIFLLLALVGIPLAWRAGAFGKTLLAFLLVWLLQFAALWIIQPYFQISGYRVDKTFYILVFPLALLAALPPARAVEHLASRVGRSRRALVVAFIVTLVALSAGVLALRPPKSFAPFTESELQTALWAKAHLDTYQISYLDPLPIRAYWLAFGLWGEKIPNEWFQWIPAGTKLGPKDFNEWLRDPAWPQWLLVRDVRTLVGADAPLPVRVLYQNGMSAILQKDSPPLAAPAPAHPTHWYFGSTLRLLGYDLPRATFSPGETITLTTYTESIYPPPATVAWRVRLSARDGTVVSQVEGEPFANKYPLQRWPPGRIARDMWALPLDTRVAPGVYNLQMGLYRRTDGEFIDVHPLFSEQAPQEHFFTAPLTKIKIPLAPPSADELRAATPLQARVGENFALPRYALQVDRAARIVRLTLYWQSLAKTENDYTVFVHLVDASGKIIAQSDAQPVRGTYPTSIWDAQEIVKDEHTLTIPADAPAPHSIKIGMYAYPSLRRLPVDGNDHIVLDFRF